MSQALQSFEELQQNPKGNEAWPPQQHHNVREEETARRTDQRRIKQKMEEFSKETTLHGVRYITDNRFHSARRILWSVFLLCLMVWLAYGIIAGVQKYFSYPVSTVIVINHVESLDFPAVTFCNYNQFRRSKLKNDPPVIRQILAALSTGNTSGVDWETYDENFANFNANFNLTRTLIDYGHRLEEMLIECRWNTGEECGTRNLTMAITDFGLCYTFNGATSERRLVVSRAGSSTGLKLRLSVQQDDYYWGYFTGAGFKVLVHPRGEMPLVGQLGDSVSPGFETSFAIGHVISESLPSPYKSNCSDKILQYSKTYTIIQCTFECKIKYVLEKCGCRFYKHPGTEELCNPKEVVQCVIPTTEEFYTLSDNCECPVPCRDEFYVTSLSMTCWPSNFVGESIAAETNKTKDYIRDNFLELRVYFDMLTDQKILQDPSFSALDLQSDVGAYMGLLCGASAITIFEFLDFILVAIAPRRR